MYLEHICITKLICLILILIAIFAHFDIGINCRFIFTKDILDIFHVQ